MSINNPELPNNHFVLEMLKYSNITYLALVTKKLGMKKNEHL